MFGRNINKGGPARHAAIGDFDRIEGRIAEIDAKLDRILEHSNNKLQELRSQLEEIRATVSAPRAVAMANGRILLKSRVRDVMFLVDASDRLLAPHLIMHGTLESAVTNFLLRNLKPEGHFLDIGANFGYFTCIGARIIGPRGHVHAVEADPATFEYLRDNVHINWLESAVSLHNFAISDTVGELRLYRRIGRSGNTSIIHLDDSDVAKLGEEPSQPFTIASKSLDSLLPELGPVDIAKIDVEGCESLVMAGAANFFAANPSIRVAMEWSPGQLAAAGSAPSELLDRLADLKLTVHVIDDRGEFRTADRSALLSSRFETLGLLGPGASRLANN